MDGRRDDSDEDRMERYFGATFDSGAQTFADSAHSSLPPNELNTLPSGSTPDIVLKQHFLFQKISTFHPDISHNLPKVAQASVCLRHFK